MTKISDTGANFRIFVSFASGGRVSSCTVILPDRSAFWPSIGRSWAKLVRAGQGDDEFVKWLRKHCQEEEVSTQLGLQLLRDYCRRVGIPPTHTGAPQELASFLRFQA